MVAQEPTLFEHDLGTTGRAMLHFRERGLRPEGVIQLSVVYPQLLWKTDTEIDSTMELLGRYQISIDTLSC